MRTTFTYNTSPSNEQKTWNTHYRTHTTLPVWHGQFKGQGMRGTLSKKTRVHTTPTTIKHRVPRHLRSICNLCCCHWTQNKMHKTMCYITPLISTISLTTKISNPKICMVLLGFLPPTYDRGNLKRGWEVYINSERSIKLRTSQAWRTDKTDSRHQVDQLENF